MGIRYRIDQELGVTFALWEGTVTAGEFLENAKRMIADPEWPPRRRLHLVDVRAASRGTGFDVSMMEEAARLFVADPQKTDTMKVAIVAGQMFQESTRFQEILSRVSRQGTSVIVFNSIEVACVWLGIDVHAAQEILRQLETKP